MLTVGSLFSGIGGLELGLEMTGGFETKWQVEIDEYATKVLEKHWPNVPKFRDIRECGKHNLEPVDLICGGFPCQDISNAGKRAGIEGERSGLWKEYYRIICELRPSYVLVENVSALRYRGLARVLGDLAQAGYDASWQCLRASDFGLPHKRERLFIVAYSSQVRFHYRRQTNTQSSIRRLPTQDASTKMVRLCNLVAQLEEEWGTPSVCRKDDGLPYWLDRLGCLGNAVVPQVAEYLGQCILSHANQAEVAA